MQALNATANKLLDVAESYTQTRGFNAFSYKDLQREVGVKTSSIHYYFPTKQDLALAMTQRYSERFAAALQVLNEQEETALGRLEGVIALYAGVVQADKFCLCGMLASDMMGLPEAVHDLLVRFFDQLENWLEETLRLGMEQGSIKPDCDARQFARQFASALEGSMLVARARRDSGYLRDVMNSLLALATR